jgi:hypothetical protein
MHLSLDEAREELKKRWKDEKLKKKIEVELGDKFMSAFNNGPRGVSFRQICSPDNGFTFFYQCSKYIGAEPLILEYHDDIFTHINEEKKGLGRLRIVLDDGIKATVDIMNFHENEKKPLSKVKIKSGENLVDFHHNLFNLMKFDVNFLENTDWFKNIGHAQDYYYYLLLHFIAHGVLFETFSLDERERGEAEFVNNIVISNIKKVEEKFGLKPLIVRSYPENQDDDEDFYWWCYPSNINDFLVNFANENRFSFKKIKM